MKTVQAHQYVSNTQAYPLYSGPFLGKDRSLLSDELEVLNLYIQIEHTRFENKFEYEINIADIDASTVEYHR
jgi:hypothetical protein